MEIENVNLFYIVLTSTMSTTTKNNIVLQYVVENALII